MTPFEVAASAAAVAAALCWLAAEITGEHSWVDRVWSILPPAYVAYFAFEAGFTDPRLLVMAILAALWGGRLTYNFARKGVPILFFFNGVHADYHRETDEVEKIDTSKLSRVAKVGFYLGAEIANTTQRPEWNPESYKEIVGSER